MPVRDKALAIIDRLAASAGVDIGPHRAFLLKDHKPNTWSMHRAGLESVRDAAISGFFHCACNRTLFCNMGDIASYYGRTVDEVYPYAGPTFMALARTYWTFKVTIIRLGRDASVAVRLLWEIDTAFAGVFFPTPGPMTPSTQDRKIAMTAIIAASGAPFDLMDYLFRNPYL